MCSHEQLHDQFVKEKELLQTKITHAKFQLYFNFYGCRCEHLNIVVYNGSSDRLL